MRVGVLISGRGSNLQALLDTSSRDAPFQVAVVVSNVQDAPGLERARRAGVPARWLDHRGRPRRAFEADLALVLRAARVDLICLAGFLRILSPWFINEFRNRILNIHPALLPLFGGPGMHGMRVHEAVLAAGVEETGCTVHLVDERIDGGPILAQALVPAHPTDTPATLADRVGAAEHLLYPYVVRQIAEGRIPQVAIRSEVASEHEAAVESEVALQPGLPAVIS